LRRIAEVASSNLPLEQSITTIVSESAKLMGAEVVAVGLLNEQTGNLTIRPEWTHGMESLKQPFSIDTYSPDFANSVLNSKRILVTNDLRNDGRVLPVYRAMGDRFIFDSMIQMPLIVRERGIGEIILGRRGDSDFDMNDERLSQAIAAQIAAGVERAQLYEATDATLRARIQELDALTHVSNELNLTIQLDRVIDVIRTEAARTTNAEGATLVLVRPDSSAEVRFGPVADVNGLAPIEQSAVSNSGTVLVGDYAVTGAPEPMPKTARTGIASAIKYGESVSGVLHVYSSQPNAFGTRTADFIGALANQAGIAIGNARRNKEQFERSEQLRQRSEQLNLIFELGRSLRSGDKLENVLDAVATGIVAAANFHHVLIYQVEGDNYRPIATSPRSELAKLQTIHRTTIDTRMIARYQLGESYFIPASGTVNAVGWQEGDLLYVPLRSAIGEIVGVMQVDDPDDGRRPKAPTVEALEIFGNQAAFAIENFRLVNAFQSEAEAARRERDRLAQLHLVASEIQRAGDIPTRLQVIADGIRSAGWGRVAITLRDQNLEPRETITAGYSEEELRQYRQHLLKGIVWQQRLSDPDFRRFRVGQAYYLRHSDQWATENKLIAGAALDDTPTDPERWHPQDTVYLPLYGLDRSRLIGVISMDSPGDGKPPIEASMRPIELFAVQASSTIENTRLYEETIRSAQQEARLNEVMEAVSSTLDLNEIIQAVANGLQQMIAFTRMSVALYDERIERFEVRRVTIDFRDEMKVDAGEPIAMENTAVGLMLTTPTARIYHLADADRTPDFVDLKAWRDSGERTTMLVPLVAGGRVLGVLHMGSELASAFGFEEQLPLVSRLGNLTAIAIENARLFQQAIDRERFSAALRRVGESVNAMLDMTGVLNTVCEEARSILDVSGAYIWLVQNNELVGIAANGVNELEFTGLRRPVDTPRFISSAVVKQRSAVFINGIGADAEYIPAIKPQDGTSIQAMLGVPLLRENEAVGALVVTQTAPNRPFTADDIEKASTLAFQASIAIENARLYQETLGLQSFNEAIIQSIQQGIVVLNRDLIIQTINSFMMQNYNWDKSGIGMHLYEYREFYKEFLSTAISNVLTKGQPETLYGIRQSGPSGDDYVRNFYVYPLLQGQTVNGIVILVEDVTERAALEADVEARASQLAVLTEVSGKLTATLEPNAVMQLLLDELGRILAYDNVVLWERVGGKLIIRAARGYAESQQLIGVEAEIADSDLFREIASRGQVLNIPDITRDPRFPMSELRPIRSWLGVSLVSKNNLTGLLVIEKEEAGFYTQTMEQLALNFSNQSAIALENARLYAETSKAAVQTSQLYQEAASRAAILDQQAQRFGLLNRVSSALAQSLDIENIFEVALRETNELLGVDLGGAVLFDAENNQGRVVMEVPRSENPPIDEFVALDNPLMDQMRADRQSILIKNVPEDPRMNYARDLMESRGITTILFIPLTVGGQVIGSLGYSLVGETREFSPEQIELAETIASQTAVAVQNANLYEQSVVRTRELETLFEATQSISTTLDLREVMDKTAKQMGVALQVEHVLITTWDNVENRLVVELDYIQGGSSLDAPNTAWNLTDYPVRERSLRARQAILVRANDMRLDSNEKKLLDRRGAVTRMVLPMIVREQSIGLIELETPDTEREFSSGEVRLARTLASQAAIAIDNARLQSETASKLEELFVINELSTALSSSIELRDIFNVVHNQLPGLVKAQTLMMGILDEDGVVVSYPVAVKDQADLPLESHTLGDDEVSFIIKRRMPQFLAGDEMADVLRNLRINMRMPNVRCFLGVPMIAGDQVVGALAVTDDRNARAFTLDDQRILNTVGNQIAVAVQNAWLFSRTREFAATLGTAVDARTRELAQERDRIDFLYQITSGLTSSLDTELVLNRALEMIARSVNADSGAIIGVDVMADTLVYRATFNLQDRAAKDILDYGPNEGLAGWVIQSQQSIVVGDVQKDPRWLRISDRDDSPKSALAALLEANEDILGVIMLYSQQRDNFNDDQLRLVVAAAKQVASAMNNAELYSLIREQAERLGAMVRREQVEATKNAAIVDSIADGVMVADQSGEIIQFNSAAQRILNLSRQSVIHHQISELAGLYAGGGGARWLEAIEKWTADPTLHQPGENVEVQLHLDNDRYVSVILSPVNMGDQFLGTVSVFRDITREIEVDRMKSEFVATVSHELRTPMTSIKGYADLLLLGAAGKVNEQQQRFLSTIKTNADRLSILVNELLDISKVDRGTVRMSFRAVDIAEIADTSISHLQGRIENEQKQINYQVNLPDDLPQIRADFDKLTQILNNLLDNAFNYTYPGGTITLSAYAEARSVVISVSDTGVGIPKEKQDRIWQRFYRDEDQPLVMNTSGTGLGLAIVKEYIKMHEGDIWLESEVGKGTTFFVRMPIYTDIMGTAEAVQTA
jgi:PAS domain S-box-containing protein